MSSYWVKRPRQNKYGNRKTKIIFKGEEVEFDSKREAARAKELELMERAGMISNLEIQKPFELLPAHRDALGRMYRPTKYIADFCYIDMAGNEIVEDVKSKATKNDSTYRLKRKMMSYCLGIAIREVE